MTIEGKAVLVTGANRGIGKALVEEALRRGAKRVYAGTRQPLAKSDERIAPLTLDVTDTAQIQAAVESVESLDVLINGRMGDFDHAPSFTEGTKGVEIVPELAPSARESIVDKTRYSAFVNARLESILKTSGVDTLIVTGLMTQYCSVTTTRHGHDLDYRMVFVVNANAGPDLPDAGFGAVPHADARRVIATSLAGGIADVIDTEATINALRSQTPNPG
jgi:nicotinamidase-related amidase